jgi:hypothetical protein
VPADEEIPFEELELLQTVASGHSGGLHKGRWKHLLVAVKMIRVRGAWLTFSLAVCLRPSL